MRALLCYPFRDDAYHKLGFIVPPMGLAYIAASLKAAGHDVVIRDFNVNRGPVDFKRFDVVGISMDTNRYKSGLKIASEAKAAGLTVIAGGAHVSFMDEDALRTGLIDYVIRGEGEITVVELLKSIETKSGPSGVNGVSYLAGGELKRTPNRLFIDDLDSLRPARELFDMKLYRSIEMAKRKLAPVITSRGCPYGCSFCSSSEIAGRKWRAMSAVKVVDEVEQVVKEFDYGGVAFMDDNFSMDDDRVMGICDEIIRRKLDIYWWCLSRGDKLMKNEPMVKRMAEAGCKYVFVGFESADQSILDAYKKGTTESAAKDVVGMLRSYGISTQASFIIGGIRETRSMALKTISYAKRINPQAVQFSILTPYPGTRLFDQVKDRITTFDWDLYDCMNPVLRCDHLSAKEIKGLLKRAYMSFYLSPGKIFDALMSGFRGRGVRLGSIIKILKGTA